MSSATSKGSRLPGFPTLWISEPLTAIAFWMAILLPALYVPMLVNGITSRAGLGLFLGLFGVHIVMLLAGRASPVSSR